MKYGDLLSVGEFAKLSRTASRTLHYYDNAGILSPVFRTVSGYRYYSVRQLAVCNMIRTMVKLGLSLAEIKELKERRTPELARDILIHQNEELKISVNNLLQAQRLISTLLQSVQTGIDADKESITIQFMPEERIILGEPIDHSEGKNAYKALSGFYQAMNDKCSSWDMNYPVWGVFSDERIKRRDWICPDRYYFYNPDGYDCKPAAFYAIGYMYAGYGQGGALYERLVEYISANGFEICGSAYEEYPLNEICITDDTKYLIRVMITIRKKDR